MLVDVLCLFCASTELPTGSQKSVTAKSIAKTIIVRFIIFSSRIRPFQTPANSRDSPGTVPFVEIKRV
jgi:hypothetical protein